MVKKYKTPIICFPLLLVFVLFGCGGWFFATVSMKFSAHPTSGYAPLTVTFIATGESSDLSKARLYSYILLQGGNMTAPIGKVAAGDTTLTFISTYETAGTYQPSCTINFSDGQQATASLEITVLATTGATGAN